MATNSSGISTKKNPLENTPYSTATTEGAPSATNNGNQGLGVAADGNTFGPTGAFGTPSTGSGYQGMESQPPTNGYAMPEPAQQGGMPQYSGLGQTPQADPYANLFPSSSQGSMGFGGYSQTPSGGQNPYLQDQADSIKTQFNQNLQEQVLPGLRDKFIGSGGLGGSRQGIAEGLAAGRSGQGLASALASLYGNSWEQGQNRQLQLANINQQGGFAQRADELNRLNSERNFYSTNRGQDLQQAGLAAGLLGQANQGFIGQGQGLYNLGTQEQNAPWQQLGAYSGLLQPYTQAGATNSGVGTQQYQYNPTQQWAGLGLQAAALFSDVRLKENIKPVGETYDGLGVYTYNYKGDDKPQMGVMAQEVERKRPDALGPTVNGFKTVRYGLLG